MLRALAAFLLAVGSLKGAATPTPAFTPGTCPQPFPAVFTPQLTPILTPAYTWQVGVHEEPNALKMTDGTWHMTYTGGWGPQSTGLLTSPSGLPGTWTEYQNLPIVGGGYGGETATANAGSQALVGTTKRLYYKDLWQNICYADSADGFSYSKVGIAVDHTALAGVDSHITGFYNTDVTKTGSTWYMLVDAVYDIQPQFQDWLFTSVDDGATFQPAGTTPLLGQQIGGVLWGAPTILKIANIYANFYLVGYPPSNIYKAYSPDMYNWYADSAMTLSFNPPGTTLSGGTSNLFGLAACDQAGDSTMVPVGNKTYIYYDGVDNLNGKSRIGWAVYDGTPEQFYTCVIPSLGGSPSKTKDKTRQ